MMTYNFDPDQWYENQKAALAHQYQKGDLADEEYRNALEELERRYEDMVRRLDGTFRIE
ncbi:MAG: hypothetical protein P8Z49_11580 [Acidobacteriota bacterium]